MNWFVRSSGKLAAATLLLLSLVACSEEATITAAPSLRPLTTITLDVYKSRTCVCCEKWVEHVEASGFETVLHHPTNLSNFKIEKGLAARYQSCHTAVSQDGYVFEGHIPADLVQRFLANPPSNSLGLAVPGMPVGSPGMEMGNRHDDYDVLVLYKDGSNAVYERISSAR